MNGYKLRKLISVSFIALGVITFIVWLFIISSNYEIVFVNKYLWIVALGIIFIGIIAFPYDALKHYVKDNEKGPNLTKYDEEDEKERLNK